VCDPGYTGDYCLSPLEDVLKSFGGKPGFACAVLGTVLFFALLGYCCRSRKDHDPLLKMEKQRLMPTMTKKSWTSKIFQCCFWQRVTYPKLQEKDLKDHMARMYLSGINTYESPLRLRSTVPRSLEPVLYNEQYLEFADKINRALTWRNGCFSGKWGNFMTVLASFICFPIASEIMEYRKHRRINHLKQIITKDKHACMKGISHL